MTSVNDDLSRLAQVIERQRRELDALRATSDVTAVIAMARGVLMERSGCTAPEAAAQLADMAAAAGLPLPEIAAATLHRQAAPGAGPGPAPATGSLPLRELLALAAADRAGEGALVGALAGEVLGPLGAAALAVWLLNPDGALELLGERGLGGMAASQWRFLPPQFDCPAQRAVRAGTDFWWPAGPPDGHPTVTSGRLGHDAARAVLVLRDRGALLGVLLAWWPGPLAEFTDETRRWLTGLATGLAGVLGTRLARGGLLPSQDAPSVLALLEEVAESVLVVQPVLDEAGSVLDFAISRLSRGYIDPAGRDLAELAGKTLLEAYPDSTAAGLFARARRVLASGEPQHVPGVARPPLAGPEPDRVEVADMRAVPFFTGVAFTWRVTGEAARTVELLGHAQRLGQLGGWEEDLVTGSARWTDSAFAVFGLDPVQAAPIPTSELHNFVMATDRPQVQRFRQEMLRRRGPDSAVFRVVRPGDGAIRQIKIFAEPVTAGTSVVALRGAFQDVSAHYHTQVALAATRDQLADSEQRAAEEHLLALRLQQAIMPPGQQPAVAMGIELAVRYRPVEPGRLVGGDWYDSMLLPTKELLVVVGDITGHGMDAVTGMVAARNALRGLAATGPAAGLLEQLNHVACHLTEGLAGTVICALYNPDSRLLRWARAGHLPPVLIRDARAAALPLPDGVLLGLDPDARYEEAQAQMRPGDMLLLFTDGLIERRSQAITDTLAEFVALAAAAPDADAEAEADRMLANGVSDTGDDACLVAMRVL